MEIKPTSGAVRIVTDNKDPDKLATTKSTSNGISETRDSFETTQEGSPLSDLGIFSGPLIGTMIGSAIGDAANDSAEDAAKTPTTPRKSSTANDEASQIAEQQKGLIDKEKEVRRQSYSFFRKPDDD
ncbi:MAG TPA: hypothetical protein VLH08_12515 [Acidobacteriota bacterium]|nr:hypothetical protein [Acidobacteriota bacterium]